MNASVHLLVLTGMQLSLILASHPDCVSLFSSYEVEFLRIKNIAEIATFCDLNCSGRSSDGQKSGTCFIPPVG